MNGEIKVQLWFLAILILILFLVQGASAAVYYRYGCEDNNISAANFTGTGLSCTTQTVINGTRSIRVVGGTSGAAHADGIGFFLRMIPWAVPLILIIGLLWVGATK